MGATRPRLEAVVELPEYDDASKKESEEERGAPGS